MKIAAKTILLFLIINCQLSIVNSSFAQCAMCKRAAESNMNDNQNNVGKGLNKGILYLLSVPYLLGGIGLLAWYSERRRKGIMNK